jgi:hypothetical protein
LLLAFRILESHDCGDSIALTLSRDGLENPKAASVLLESDDIKNYKKQQRLSIEYAPGFNGRPKVLVNGVEMFLMSLKEHPIYDMGTTLQTPQTTFWVVGGKMKKMSSVKIAKRYEIVMVVSWN